MPYQQCDQDTCCQRGGWGECCWEGMMSRGCGVPCCTRHWRRRPRTLPCWPWLPAPSPPWCWECWWWRACIRSCGCSSWRPATDMKKLQQSRECLETVEHTEDWMMMMRMMIQDSVMMKTCCQDLSTASSVLLSCCWTRPVSWSHSSQSSDPGPL